MANSIPSDHPISTQATPVAEGAKKGSLGPFTVQKGAKSEAIESLREANLPPTTLTSGTDSMIRKQVDPEGKIWQKAMNNWKAALPQGSDTSELTFAKDYLIEHAVRHIQAPPQKGSHEEALLASAASILAQSGVKELDAAGTKINISTAPLIKGREKVRLILTSDLLLDEGKLGEGGGNIASKVNHLVFVAKTTKPDINIKVKERVIREAKKEASAALSKTGNESLKEIFRKVSELQKKGKLPAELAVRDGKPVGIVDPLEPLSERTMSDKLYNLGSFNSWIKNSNPDPETILQVFADVQEGAKWLSFFNAGHIDLKPDNIYVTVGKDGKITGKIADWDGVRLNRRITPPYSIQKVLDATKPPIFNAAAGYTFRYNISNDLQQTEELASDIEKLRIKMQKKVEELTIEGKPINDKDFKDSLVEIVASYELLIDYVQKIQTYQIGLSLYNSLGEKSVPADPKENVGFGLRKNPIAPENIETVVSALPGLSEEVKDGLFDYFSATIGEKFEERGFSIDAGDLYQSVLTELENKG